MSDELLPGEGPEFDLRDDATLKTLGLGIIKASLEGTPEDFFQQVIALYHAEWERRYGETWVIAG